MTDNGPHPGVTIRALEAEEAESRLDDLAAILVDAVAGGASVNFLAAFTPAEAAAYWRRQLPGLADGSTRLFVADDGTRLVGTVLLFLMQQPNQPHRAEIGKMLVLSQARRQGLGRRLLAAAEMAALELHRPLLMLDTTSGSAGDKLYRRSGWTPFGEVPGHALSVEGTPSNTTFFYKWLRDPDVVT